MIEGAFYFIGLLSGGAAMAAVLERRAHYARLERDSWKKLAELTQARAQQYLNELLEKDQK